MGRVWLARLSTKIIYRGTSICGILIVEWVLIFQNFVVMVSMGTYIRRVLVFDGYLYSRMCAPKKL